MCIHLPAANSSTVMSGKRMRVRALPRTFCLFSAVIGSCCLKHSASDQRTTAPNRRLSLMPSVSLSSTAHRVSAQTRTALLDTSQSTHTASLDTSQPTHTASLSTHVSQHTQRRYRHKSVNTHSVVIVTSQSVSRKTDCCHRDTQ